MKNFSKYVGRTKTIKDSININKAKMFSSMFIKNFTKINYLKKKILPYGWHWLYFSEYFPIQESDEDGHPKRGDFFPLFRGFKRMFAGSELEFLDKILIDNIILKTVKISNIEKKTRNNSNIYFVNLKNTFKFKKKIVLIENQKIVFLDKKYKSSGRKIVNETGYKTIYKKQFLFNNILLFRYSALTYNSHRIHYDLEYARKKEGYKNLLVHGPLLSTFSLDLFNFYIKKEIAKFSFKMIKPVFVNEKIFFKILKCLNDTKNYQLRIVDANSSELKFIATCICK